MKKWLAIATAMGSLTACGGGSSSPTAPTPPANIAGPYSATITAASTCSANLPFPVLVFATTITQTGAAVDSLTNIAVNSLLIAIYVTTDAVGRGA